MRKIGVLLSLALVLGLSSRSNAAVADWADETDHTGGFFDYTAGNGGPSANQPEYTIDFRFKPHSSWAGNESSWAIAIEAESTGTKTVGFELGHNNNENRIAHTFAKSGSGNPAVNAGYAPTAESWEHPEQYSVPLVGDQWYVARLVVTSTGGVSGYGTVKSYLDGNLLYEDEFNGPLPNPFPDGHLRMTAAVTPGKPSTVDYIRVVNSALSANEPLNAVPEPASALLVMVGAGLGLAARRRRV